MKCTFVCSICCVMSFLAITSIARSETIIDDFDSYTDPNDLLAVWGERNPNAEITLAVIEPNAPDNAMNYEYWCGSSPYWTEAFTIFPTDQDWSMYDTFSMWVKGKITSQSLEDMYLAIYKGKTADPVDHSQLELLGKARFYAVTRKPDWTYWRADIDYNFESLSTVRAIGIGVTPTSYGHGVIQIDAIAVDDTGLGGVIDNFETYVDSNSLSEAVSTYGNCTMSLEDVEVFEGGQAVKIEVDYGSSPYWAKLMFSENIRHLGYNWNSKGYDSLTVHFKVEDADGYIQVALVDNFGGNTAVYKYNNGVRIPEGDWIRWDIDIREILDTSPTALNDVRRVDIHFQPEDYGQGVVYLDDIYVNVCGSGASGVGGLRSNLYDGDCIINCLDFSVFASHWQETGCTAPDYCGGADFLIGGVRDGEVNILDLAVIVNEWTECNLLYSGDCF